MAVAGVESVAGAVQSTNPVSGCCPRSLL